MTVTANHPRIITVEWSGVEADGKGTLDITQLPNRLTAEHLEQLAAALYEASETPRLRFKHFVLLF
jgi:hypothetical protein